MSAIEDGREGYAVGEDIAGDEGMIDDKLDIVQFSIGVGLVLMLMIIGYRVQKVYDMVVVLEREHMALGEICGGRR